MKRLLQFIVPVIGVILFNINLGWAQEYSRRFNHIGLEDGLSQNSVYAVFQDSRGYMWFGTADGLNRYDGKNMVVYRHEAFVANSLSANWVSCIAEDKTGTLWIGTHGGGLNSFDPIHEKFEHFSAGENILAEKSNIIRNVFFDGDRALWVGSDAGLFKIDTQTRKFVNWNSDSSLAKILNVSVNAIAMDNQQNLWIGTWGNGLVGYNLENKSFKHYLKKYDSDNSLSYDRVKALVVGENQTLWIGTRGGGLNKLDIGKEKFTVYQHQPGNPNSLIDDKVYALLNHNDQEIWVGTYYDGISRLDIETNTWEAFQYSKEAGNSVAGNWIPALYKDRSGLLWVGTDNGVSTTPVGGTGFIHIRQFSSETGRDITTNINAMYQDSAGHIWLGTWGEGLIEYGANRRLLNNYRAAENGALSDNRVWCIEPESGHQIWIGTGNGLSLFNMRSGKFKIFRRDYNNPVSSLPHNNISVVKKIGDKLWIGTWGSGLAIMDATNHQVEKQINTTNSDLTDNYIKEIYQDSAGRIWVGTANGGLVLMYADAQISKVYQNYIDERNSLIGNNIESIMEDENGTVWVATNASGISLIKPGQDDFTHLTSKDGLPSNSVRRLLIDHSGLIWISSLAGITSYNSENGQIRNFSKRDGLQSNEFARGAFVDDNGYLYFGGSNGFNVFHPDSIYINDNIPPVVITRFLLRNRELRLDSMLQTNDLIAFSHQEDVFTFEFRALDYYYPAKNKYLYKLEGFDNDWRKPVNDNFATYTNLPAGEYTFRVKAANNHGFWNNEGASVKIKVNPPIYQTWPFILTVFFVLVLAIVAFVRYREYRLRRDSEKLQKLVVEKTGEIITKNALLQQKNGEITEQKQQIEQQKAEVEAQRDMATEQRDLIQKQKQELTDSIYYAQRIQQAVLPKSQVLNKYFPESFIYFKPRDIVSGDYYWLAQKNGKKLFAVADCTGHGVPGGFMSMLGIAFLNQIVSRTEVNLNPAEILDQLRELVITSLHQSEFSGDTKDGIDIAMCVYDEQKQELLYAGAHNPLYIVKNGELLTFKADRMPIGIYAHQNQFTCIRYPVKKGDRIYLFSDGYTDQFGGEFNRKFMRNQFRKLIYDIQKLPMSEQSLKIEENLVQWMGNNMQIDDILIMGVEI